MALTLLLAKVLWSMMAWGVPDPSRMPRSVFPVMTLWWILPQLEPLMYAPWLSPFCSVKPVTVTPSRR